MPPSAGWQMKQKISVKTELTGNHQEINYENILLLFAKNLLFLFMEFP